MPLGRCDPTRKCQPPLHISKETTYIDGIRESKRQEQAPQGKGCENIGEGDMPPRVRIRHALTSLEGP